MTLDGQPVPHLLQWRGGFGDLTLTTVAGSQRTLYYDFAQNKLVEQAPKTAAKGPITSNGNFSFAGIADTYFAAVFLPEGASSTQQITFEDTVKTPLTAGEEKPVALSGVAVGDTPSNRFELFVGPKDVDLLRRINPKLEQVVDFGWLSVLAKPLFLIVNYVNDALVHNFGWAIVLVTVAINFILFPLKLSNMKSMRKMRRSNRKWTRSAPSTERGFGIPKPPIRAGDDGPVQEAQGQSDGRCIPMMRKSPSSPSIRYSDQRGDARRAVAPGLPIFPAETLPKILPLVMITSQFIMQRMTPQPAGDPAQQKMMMFMPLSSALCSTIS